MNLSTTALFNLAQTILMLCAFAITIMIWRNLTKKKIVPNVLVKTDKPSTSRRDHSIIYRCRMCSCMKKELTSTHVESLTDVVHLLVSHEEVRFDSIATLRRTTFHICKGGSIGIADIIGVAPEEPV